MVRPLVAVACLSIVALASPSAFAQACNPYTTACPGGPTGPSFNPYDPNLPHGPYTGSGPYAPGQNVLDAAAQRWVLNGDLFIDQNNNRFGWLILDNLSATEQIVIVEYMSEQWAAPAYRFVHVGPRARVSLGLHDEGAVLGVYFSARVYFPTGPGSIHATFRPHASDTIGQHDVPGVLVPPVGTH